MLRREYPQKRQHLLIHRVKCLQRQGIAAQPDLYGKAGLVKGTDKPVLVSAAGRHPLGLFQGIPAGLRHGCGQSQPAVRNLSAKVIIDLLPLGVQGQHRLRPDAAGQLGQRRALRL